MNKTIIKTGKLSGTKEQIKTTNNSSDLKLLDGYYDRVDFKQDKYSNRK